MALAEYGNAFNIDTDGSGNPILIDPQSGDTIAVYDRGTGSWQVTTIEAATGDFNSVNTAKGRVDQSVRSRVSGIFDNTQLEMPHDVYVREKIAYVACRAESQSGGRFAAVDLTDPNNAVILDSILLSNDPKLNNMTIRGSTAYISNSGTGGVHIIDISNPSSLSEIDFWSSPNHGQGTFLQDATGDLLLFGGQNYIEILDISNRHEIYERSRIVDNNNLTNPHPGAVRNNWAYLTGGGADNILTIDLTDPDSPTAYYASHADLDAVQDGALDGTVFYVTSQDGDAVVAFDVSDPSNPSSLGSVVNTDKLRGAHSVHVMPNDRLMVTLSDVHHPIDYTADVQGGIAIIDISDPSNMTIGSVYRTPEMEITQFADISDGYIVTADTGANGLNVLEGGHIRAASVSAHNVEAVHSHAQWGHFKSLDGGYANFDRGQFDNQENWVLVDTFEDTDTTTTFNYDSGQVSSRGVAALKPVLTISGQGSGAEGQLQIRLNGDSTTNYYYRQIAAIGASDDVVGFSDQAEFVDNMWDAHSGLLEYKIGHGNVPTGPTGQLTLGISSQHNGDPQRDTLYNGYLNKDQPDLKQVSIGTDFNAVGRLDLYARQV